MWSKEEVIQAFVLLVQEKICRIQTTLRDLTESAAGESKSTAGDKHETALAMLQLEQEQKNKELAILINHQEAIEKAKKVANKSQAVFGSLIVTDKFLFLICASIGKLVVREKTVVALSSESPLGKLLLGLEVGQSCDFQNEKYLVMEIL